MPIEVRGLEELIESCLRFPVEARAEIHSALHDVGKVVTTEARSKHNFKRKSGNLQRSIRYETTGERSLLMRLRIYLDSRLTTTRTKSGKEYSYGLIQHDGTGQGYKQSWGSPLFQSKSFAGLEHDHFLTDAFDNHRDDAEKMVGDAIERIKNRTF